MSSYTSQQHAEHNFEVCQFLNDKTDYSDWIITTSFYSAIHYLRHFIFPLKFVHNRQDYTAENFDEYCRITGNNRKKHKVMRTLVEEECKMDIAAAYNNLMDVCFTARYTRYQFSKKTAQLAVRRLNVIRNYSLKK